MMRRQVILTYLALATTVHALRRNQKGLRVHKVSTSVFAGDEKISDGALGWQMQETHNETGDEGEPDMCCHAHTAHCLACSAGKDVQEYCQDKPDTHGCDVWLAIGGVQGKVGSLLQQRQRKSDEHDETGDEGEPDTCCHAHTAHCLACSAGKDVQEYCQDKPDTHGCDVWLAIGGVQGKVGSLLQQRWRNSDKRRKKQREKDEDNDDEDVHADDVNEKDAGETLMCCEAMTAECLACKAGKDVRKYCRQNPGTDGCDAIKDKRKKRRKSRDNEEDDADDSQDKRKNKRKSKDKEDDEDDSEEDKDGDEPATCCEEMTAECLACKAGKDVRKYCKQNPGTDGCDAIKDKRKKRRKSRDNDEDDEDDSEDKRKEKKRSKDKEEDDEDDFEEDKDGNEPASQD